MMVRDFILDLDLCCPDDARLASIRLLYTHSRGGTVTPCSKDRSKLPTDLSVRSGATSLSFGVTLPLAFIQ
jgi:hypothetical protein